MKQFFKYFLASGLAYLVFGVIFLFIMIGIGSSMFKGKPPVTVKNNSILHLKLDKPISETSYFELDQSTFQPSEKMGINDIVRSIDYAKTDDKIKGIYFEPTSFSAGLANLEELHDALEDFKESGKFLVSYSEGYSQASYYLASVSDEIYIYPTGSLAWSGLSSERMFFSQMLDKLEIDMQIIRGSNNKFKSAVEPFILDKMSPANREQTEKYMFSFWDHMVSEISKSRNIGVEQLNTLADEMSITNAQKAVDFKFATGIKYQDEVEDILKEKMEIEDDKKLKTISLNKYMSVAKRKMKVKNLKNHNIAIVYANGEIISGKGSPEMIGSETTVKHLRKARLADSVKAVVLRVNSPGGSALASDVIWREIELIKNYLSLEKVRYGDRVDISFENDIKRDVKIAPLVLLTFIENAFKHGANKNVGPIKIDIDFKIAENFLYFTISNPTPKITKHKQNIDSFGGIGLKNAKKRLALGYKPDEYNLSIDTKNNRYVVHLKIKV